MAQVGEKSMAALVSVIVSHFRQDPLSGAVTGTTRVSPWSLIRLGHAGEPGGHNRGQQPPGERQSEGPPSGIPVRDEGVPLVEVSHGNGRPRV